MLLRFHWSEWNESNLHHVRSWLPATEKQAKLNFSEKFYHHTLEDNVPSDKTVTVLLGTAWHTVKSGKHHFMCQHFCCVTFDMRLTPRFPSESSLIGTTHEHLQILPCKFTPALPVIFPYQAISIYHLKCRFQCWILGAHFEEAGRNLKLHGLKLETNDWQM